MFIKLRRPRCVLGRKDTEDGPLCVITPEKSGWYCAYVNNFLLDEADSFMAKKFRNRFHLPYPSYKALLHQIKSDNGFGSNVGVGTSGMARNHPALSCYFLDR